MTASSKLLEEVLPEIRVQELVPMVLKLRATTAWAVGGFVASLLVLTASGTAYATWHAYPFLTRETAELSPPEKPSHVSVDRVFTVPELPSSLSLTRPGVEYLQDEVSSEIANNRFADGMVLVAQTEPFEVAVTNFDLGIACPNGYGLSGFAYRRSNQGRRETVENLPVSKHDNGLVVSVPESKHGDELLLALKLTADTEIPSDLSKIKTCFSLEVLR